jgi:hypothetical protein
MDAPIRMLGIATTIFWIILVGFIASAGYSMKDLNFGVGEPQFTSTSNQDLMLTLPLHIDNRGYYSLRNFNLTTAFSDAEGVEISKASTFLAAIPNGENVTILHNVTLSMGSIAERANQYLFDDGNLTCTVTAKLNFADILPTQLATNVTFPWGAPFYNFQVEHPNLRAVDLTHLLATVPLSFENHAAFDLTGNISAKLLDEHDGLLSESQTAINVPKYSSYNGNLKFIIPVTAAASTSTLSGHLEVYFFTLMFEYGPVVIPYG